MKLITNLPKLDRIFGAIALKNGICAEVGDLILFSGFAGMDLESGRLLQDEPIEDHANASLDCYAYVLAELGLTLDHVIKVNCFLQDPGDFQRWNEVFKSRFTAPYPLRTTVGAPLVVGRIELEIVATRTPRAAAV